MRKILLFIAAATTMVWVFAQTPSRAPHLPKYNNPVDTAFPIVGWHAFNSSNLRTTANYRVFKNAGFNIAYFTGIDTNALSICRQTGIKLMFDLTGLSDSAKLVRIGQYSGVSNGTPQYPQIAAFNVADNPPAPDFMNLHDFLDEAIKRMTDTTLLYVNIPGNTNRGGFPTSSEELDSFCYDCYVSVYEGVVRPQFVSFRNLGFLDGDSLPHDTVINANYYANLEEIRRWSQRYDVPFWSFVASTVPSIVIHAPNHIVRYPAPTRGMLSLQIFSAIAYGAQGLQYYSYGLPTGSQASYRGGLVTLYGARTSLWNIAKELNEEVQSHANVFLGMEVHNVWHTAHEIRDSAGNIVGYTNPPNTKRLGDTDTLNVPRLPDKIHGVSEGIAGLSQTSGPGFVVSHFTNNNHNYLMIVNKDFEMQRQVSVTTDTSVDTLSISGVNNNSDTRLQINRPPDHPLLRNFFLTLEPGGFAILTW